MHFYANNHLVQKREQYTRLIRTRKLWTQYTTVINRIGKLLYRGHVVRATKLVTITINQRNEISLETSQTVERLKNNSKKNGFSILLSEMNQY